GAGEGQRGGQGQRGEGSGHGGPPGHQSSPPGALSGGSRPGTWCRRSSGPSSIAVSLPPQTAPVSMAYTPRPMNRPSVDQWPNTTGISRGAWPGTSYQGYMPGFWVPGRPLSSKPMRPAGVQ